MGMVSANVSGSYEYDAWQLMPSIGFVYFEETQKAYVDSNGFSVKEQTNSLGSLNFGPKWNYRYELGDGSIMRPLLGLKGVWDFDAPDIVDVNGMTKGTEHLRAQAEFGLEVSMSGGATFQGTYAYDGLGLSNYESHSGELMLSMPLNIAGLPKDATVQGVFSLQKEGKVSDLSHKSDHMSHSAHVSLTIPLH